MEKPLSVIIDETKINLVNVLNESGLGVLILEPIVKELYENVHNTCVQLTMREKAEYEASLKAENESEENANN